MNKTPPKAHITTASSPNPPNKEMMQANQKNPPNRRATHQGIVIMRSYTDVTGELLAFGSSDPHETQYKTSSLFFPHKMRIIFWVLSLILLLISLIYKFVSGTTFELLKNVVIFNRLVSVVQIA